MDTTQLSPDEISEFAEFMEYKRKSELLLKEFRQYQASKKLVNEKLNGGSGSTLNFSKLDSAASIYAPEIMAPLLSTTRDPSAEAELFQSLSMTPPPVAVSPPQMMTTSASSAPKQAFLINQMPMSAQPIRNGTFRIVRTQNSNVPMVQGQLQTHQVSWPFNNDGRQRHGIKRPVPNDSEVNDVIVERVISPAVKRLKVAKPPNMEFNMIPNISPNTEYIPYDHLRKVGHSTDKIRPPIGESSVKVSTISPYMGQQPLLAAKLQAALPMTREVSRPTAITDKPAVTPTTQTPANAVLDNSPLTNDESDDEAHIIIAIPPKPIPDSIENDLNADDSDTSQPQSSEPRKPQDKNEASRRAREEKKKRQEARRKKKAELDRKNAELTAHLQTLRNELTSLRLKICDSCYEQAQNFIYNVKNRNDNQNANIFTLKKCRKDTCSGSRDLGLTLDRISAPIVATM